MTKLALTLITAMIIGPAFADEPGIPYALQCSGKVTAQGTKGMKITLNTQHNEEGLMLVRALLRPNGSPISAAVEFQVKSIGNKNGRFEVSSVGRVFFAGSGSLTGNLSMNRETQKATWTETTSQFDETTGLQKKTQTKYNLSCSLAE
ncbi:MAG: hypothetical protein ACKOA8_04205 [Deltaproteobacteria bacterium]